MPRGERFRFDRLSEAEFEQLRRFLEIGRGQWRRPIILGPDELLIAKQGSQTPTSAGQGLMPMMPPKRLRRPIL
jgi:hypothetical protein